jgi:hypothetical protein
MRNLACCVWASGDGRSCLFGDKYSEGPHFATESIRSDLLNLSIDDLFWPEPHRDAGVLHIKSCQPRAIWADNALKYTLYLCGTLDFQYVTCG